MIYFILEPIDNVVKIGTSKESNVKTRFESVQTGNHRDLQLIGVCDGSFKEEKILHEIFKDYRLKREWFRYEKDIQEYVENNCNRYDYNKINNGKSYYKSLPVEERREIDRIKGERLKQKQNRILDSDLKILDKLFELDSNSELTYKQIREVIENHKIQGISGTILPISKVIKYFNLKLSSKRRNANITKIIKGLSIKS